MHVFIDVLSYEKPQYEVNEDTKISKLKQMIEDDLGIPVDNFKLSFKQQELENNMSLGHYNISDNDHIHINGNLLDTLRLRYVIPQDDPRNLHNASLKPCVVTTVKAKLDALYALNLS